MYERKTLINLKVSLPKTKVKSVEYITIGSLIGESNVLTFSLEEINSKLHDAHDEGEMLTITYFNGRDFDEITGIVQELDQEERIVKVVNYEKFWIIRIYDIVKIKD